jgi:hypothetical protein
MISFNAFLFFLKAASRAAPNEAPMKSPPLINASWRSRDDWMNYVTYEGLEDHEVCYIFLRSDTVHFVQTKTYTCRLAHR